MARPTMDDVAARAGVSHQTVSRVLNGSPQVSPQAKAAVDGLGHRVHARRDRLDRRLRGLFPSVARTTEARHTTPG